MSTLSVCIASGLACLALFGCEPDFSPKETYRVLTSEDPVPKGNRTYGISLSTGEEAFTEAFAHAQEAGVEVVGLNLPWSLIEPEPGHYVDPWDGILAATGFYGDHDIEVILSLAVINTVKWETPEYLRNATCNSPQFITAFQNMLSWVLETLPSHVSIRGISIGNEVNYLLLEEGDWAAYKKFFQAVTGHIHRNYPYIDVGCKTTVKDGLFSEQKEAIVSLNQFSDVVMLNYYPQDEFYHVDNPEDVYAHLRQLGEVFKNRRIWLTEVGYPSGSEFCASNQTLQAHFYHHFFIAWDSASQNIELVVVNWLNDQAPSTIEEWKDYYGDDPALIEYLSSLGLRTRSGERKYAWDQLMHEVEARGWYSDRNP